MGASTLRRRAIAERFRELQDSGLHRKAALLAVKRELGASRRSVYRYCNEFRIGTR